MVHRYINFNELLWNYEFIITKILYYENLEPYGNICSTWFYFLDIVISNCLSSWPLPFYTRGVLAEINIIYQIAGS